MASIFRVYNFVVLCFLFLLHAKVDASVTWRNQPTSATGIRGQSVSITWTADLVVNETWNFVKVYQKVSGTKYEMIRERKDYGKTVYSRYSSREADLSLTASQNGTLLTTVFTLNNLNRPTDEHIYYLRIDHTANGGDSDDSSDLQLTVFDGFSWIAVPDKHINVKRGYPFRMNWHYEMDENETFLSSDIDSFEVKPHKPIAVRHGEKNTYEKYQKNDTSFSISGKNNVTLTVHSAEIGRNITYCCVVRWRSEVEIYLSSMCSTVFVYDVPRITNHKLQLSCKQGDSIKLKCNATGIPKPHVGWLHKETHSLIDDSSDIVLNITGKRSEGRYCCDADNGFGKETACTVVNVTEYEPMNTMLLVNQTNRTIIYIKCKADASPPSNHFMIKIDDEKYNLSNGLKTFEVPAPRNDKMNKIAVNVSCIPRNKYGQGPIKNIVFPLYAPPVLQAPKLIRTEYNMTVSSITLKCEASGTPTPNITWTSGDNGDIVGTGESYHVSHEKCATKTMKFFCHARNEVGNVSSPVLLVRTASNCSTGLDQGTIVAIIVSACIFIIIVIFVIKRYKVVSWCRKKLAQKDQEPIDSVVPEISNATATEEDDATVEEIILSWQPISNNNPQHGKDPTYQSVPQEP